MGTKKPQPKPPKRKVRSADPTRDTIERIVTAEKTKRGLVKRLMWFWSVSTAEAQDRGFRIAQKAKDEP